jgi:putative addiction module component (TIGR02574 family)
MAANFTRIEQQARALSEDERARLALSLIKSLEPADACDLEAAWRPAIEARLAAYDRGEVNARPADEVFAEIRRLFGR